MRRRYTKGSIRAARRIRVVRRVARALESSRGRLGLLLILLIFAGVLAIQWYMSGGALGAAPVAKDDFAALAPDSINNTIDVLANDSDPDAGPLTVIAVAQPANGTAEIGPNGANVIYTPNLGFLGVDSFTYTISDGQLTATATVSIDVELVTPPASLKTVPVPEPTNLNTFVLDKPAAIQLGKALFWDMQVGSDGMTACASCHFQAGADSRVENQLSPGLLGGSTTFNGGGPNHSLTPSDFLFQRLGDDVVSSAGVHNTRFVDIVPGNPVDQGVVEPDPVFQVAGINVRRVEPRNTPSVINAVFNRRNFWDGRAQFDFNGVNPFGSRDPNAKVLEVQATGEVQPTSVSVDFGSLASQAVGPPLSGFEMSFAGRTFPKLGKKMLSLRPLGQQLVHPEDSVLAPLTNPGQTGLEASYADLIKAAFQPQWWDSNKMVTFDPNGNHIVTDAPGRALTTNEFTMMESNFSLFFGLAVQLYEATLVSDDTPFDRFMDGDTSALAPQQQAGMDVFNGNNGRCTACHSGPEFSNAAISNVNASGEILERMIMGNGEEAVYDNGFYNIGVRPTAEDVGIGGRDPFGLPLSETRLAQMGLFVDPKVTVGPDERAAVDGSFKSPQLRNAELTAPYFHNGGTPTLNGVADFYARRGDFAQENIDNLDPDLQQITLSATEKESLVAFLLGLTDERVRFERAPFDHPQLLVPNGHLGGENTVTDDGTASAVDRLLEIPAVGARGRETPPVPFQAQLEGIQPPDACPGTAPRVPTDVNGCSAAQADSDGDKVCNAGLDSDFFCTGADACPDTALGSAIDANGCSAAQVDSDGDGTCNAGASSTFCTGSDACPGTAPGASVNAAGCSAVQADSDGDGLVDAADACPGTAPGTSVDANGCPQPPAQSAPPASSSARPSAASSSRSANPDFVSPTSEGAQSATSPGAESADEERLAVEHGTVYEEQLVAQRGAAGEEKSTLDRALNTIGFSLAGAGAAIGLAAGAHIRENLDQVGGRRSGGRRRRGGAGLTVASITQVMPPWGWIAFPLLLLAAYILLGG